MLGGDTDLAVVFSYVVTVHYIFHNIYYSKRQVKRQNLRKRKRCR